MENNSGKTIHKMNNNRSFTSEQLSKWGSTGGRPLEWTDERLVALGNELLEWLSTEGEPGENIFFNEFLVKKGLYKDMIGDLVDRNKAFAEIIKVAKQIQEFKLAKGGLTGKHRDAMSIFLLKNYHQMADKVESQVTNNNTPVVIQLQLPEVEPQPKQIEANEILPEALDVGFDGVLPEPGVLHKPDENQEGIKPDENQEGQ